MFAFGDGDRWRLMFVATLSMALVRADDHPDYVPRDYIAVQEGDFKEYFELWETNENYFTFQHTQHGVELHEPFLMGDAMANRDFTLMPVYNESRYIYAQNNEEPMNWYDLWSVTENTNPRINRKDPNTVLEYQFLFYTYLFINKTHFVDVQKIYDLNEARLMEDSDIHHIRDIPNIKMTPFMKQEVMSRCMEEHCVLNMDHPGSGGLWSSKEDHYVMYKKGTFLIMRKGDTSKNIPLHYVLKYQDQHYYFPKNLPTFKWNDEFVQKVASLGDYSKRPFMIPIFRDDDEFFKKLPPPPAPPTSTTTTATTTTTTTTTTRRPKTTTEATTTTEKSPKLGIARVAVKEVCTTTPAVKSTSDALAVNWCVVLGFVFMNIIM